MRSKHGDFKKKREREREEEKKERPNCLSVVPHVRKCERGKTEKARGGAGIPRKSDTKKSDVRRHGRTERRRHERQEEARHGQCVFETESARKRAKKPCMLDQERWKETAHKRCGSCGTFCRERERGNEKERRNSRENKTEREKPRQR